MGFSSVQAPRNKDTLTGCGHYTTPSWLFVSKKKKVSHALMGYITGRVVNFNPRMAYKTEKGGWLGIVWLMCS